MFKLSLIFRSFATYHYCCISFCVSLVTMPHLAALEVWNYIKNNNGLVYDGVELRPYSYCVGLRISTLYVVNRKLKTQNRLYRTPVKQYCGTPNHVNATPGST